MKDRSIHMVTGAFGYSGRYIAKELLSQGLEVETLTSRPQSDNPFKQKITNHPFHFDAPDRLIESLRHTKVVYNTYWVRFDYNAATYQQAVENTKRLIDCAVKAGVERVVHISISNPSLDSPLPYFQGKAVLEQTIINSGLSYAIIRPTVVFGKEDILINNIGWFLRTFPCFGIPGFGSYKLQPVYVGDLAALAVQYGANSDNVVLDAVGPETYTFKELITEISHALRVKPWLIPCPPIVALLLVKGMGMFLHDVVLTRDEMKGLMAGLLVSSNPSTCETKFSVWIREAVQNLGSEYSSEVQRHYSQQTA